MKFRGPTFPSPKLLFVAIRPLILSGIRIDHQVLDGLLTYSRVNDPTFAHGDGPPPKHLTIGQEGKADVKDGGNDQIVAELNGKVSLALMSGLAVTHQIGPHLGTISTICHPRRRCRGSQGRCLVYFGRRFRRGSTGLDVSLVLVPCMFDADMIQASKHPKAFTEQRQWEKEDQQQRTN